MENQAGLDKVDNALGPVLCAALSSFSVQPLGVWVFLKSLRYASKSRRLKIFHDHLQYVSQIAFQILILQGLL